MKGGFMFKINEKQIDNWKLDYRCLPDQNNVDCGAMVLSFFGIPYRTARRLQLMANEQGELSIQNLVDALETLPQSEFENYPSSYDSDIKKIDTIDELESFAYSTIPRDYAVIVLGMRKELPFKEATTKGHFFIIFKDSEDSLYILDPQDSNLLSDPEFMGHYLSMFDDGFYIVLAKSAKGEFTKLNTLYKEPLPAKRIPEFSQEPLPMPKKSKRMNNNILDTKNTKMDLRQDGGKGKRKSRKIKKPTKKPTKKQTKKPTKKPRKSVKNKKSKMRKSVKKSKK